MNQIAQIDFDNLQNVASPNYNSSKQFADLIYHFNYLNSGGIVSYIFFGAGVLLLVYLISGGLQFMFSGGDEKKVIAAKGKITNAFLGFAIVIFAYFVVQLLALILGLSTVSNLFS